jgi:hypothetical protein
LFDDVNGLGEIVLTDFFVVDLERSVKL